MEFSGPEPADYANVQALNKAFLKHLRHSVSGKALRAQLGPELSPLAAGLTALQTRRLATAPFLLFSLRELDDVYWEALLSANPTADLFTPNESPPAVTGQIVTAALGFLWQLSSRNPYAARLVSGASLSWSERLADNTLLRLLQCADGRDDLLFVRLADNSKLWRKLLVAGISSESDVRAAAHQCALQTLLTGIRTHNYHALPAAACRMPARTLQVADRPRSRAKRKKL